MKLILKILVFIGFVKFYLHLIVNLDKIMTIFIFILKINLLTKVSLKLLIIDKKKS